MKCENLVKFGLKTPNNVTRLLEIKKCIKSNVSQTCCQNCRLDNKSSTNFKILQFIILTITIGKKKNGHRSNVMQVDKILGVLQTANGGLQYLIKWKTDNTEPNDFIDSYIMKKIYPQMVIEFYERIITWQ